MSKETFNEGLNHVFGKTVVEDGKSNDQKTKNRIALPEGILSQYEYLMDLPSGAESDAVLLRDRESGKELFCKYYRSGMSPDPMTMLLLKNADPRYVARLIDYHDSDDGCWEIQEYYPLGSMEQWVASQGGILTDVQIEEVVKSLTADLKYLHGYGSGIAHRDLKPSNILVKCTDPISLVLADFGLAKAHQSITHLTTTIKGTWHYAAPEVQSMQSSAKSDWFSLGSILYECATGRCLFSDAEGRPVSDGEARALCLSGYYSTDLIQNDRIRLLISGLLCWDKNKRWGAKEVEEWIEGKSPIVTNKMPVIRQTSSVEMKSRLNYTAPFCAEIASDFDGLAKMIRNNWGSFVEMLSGSIDEKLVSFIEAIGGSGNFAMAAQDALRILAGSDLPEYKLVQLQVVLDPFTTPLFRDVQLNSESIEKILNKANNNDHFAIAWLDAAVKTQVFGALSEVTGSAELAKTNYYLIRWSAQIEESLEYLPADQEAIGIAAKEAANPILVDCALSLGSTGVSQTIDLINDRSKKLCAANYVSKMDVVSPAIEILNNVDRNDIGYSIVLNSYLTKIYETELDRCNNAYEMAVLEIEEKNYEAAIPRLETIIAFKDAEKILQNATQAFCDAEKEYRQAIQEAYSFHFKKAHELFTGLKKYKDSIQRANATKKAVEFIESVAEPGRIIEANILKINEQISQYQADFATLSAEIEKAESNSIKIDEQVYDAEYALDALCMNESSHLTEKIRSLNIKYLAAEENIQVLRTSNQTAQKENDNAAAILKDKKAYLQIKKRSCKPQRLNFLMLRRPAKSQKATMLLQR